MSIQLSCFGWFLLSARIIYLPLFMLIKASDLLLILALSACYSHVVELIMALFSIC